jgi:hypothetical protein
MNISQTDLDRFGVALNPKHNTTLDKAKALVEWARKCGVPMGPLSVNFSNSAGGPWVMPIVPVAQIQGAAIDPAKDYCFVADNGEHGGQNLAIADTLLGFYGPFDVIHRLAAEVGIEFDPMASEYLAALVKAGVEASAPKE